MDRWCDAKGENRCAHGIMIHVCKCNFWLDPKLNEQIIDLCFYLTPTE